MAQGGGFCRLVGLQKCSNTTGGGGIQRSDGHDLLQQHDDPMTVAVDFLKNEAIHDELDYHINKNYDEAYGGMMMIDARRGQH